MTRKLSAGAPEPLGVSIDERGVNVAVFSANAEKVEICLFDAGGQQELERIALPERTADIFHGHLADVGPGARYGLRAHGPFDPQHGHRFNPVKLLIDPYARLIDRPFKLDRVMFSYSKADRVDDLRPETTDSAAAMPKSIVMADLALSPPLRPSVAWVDTVIYELHVRGFTKRHPSIPATIAGTFAGLADPAAIDHLVKLGVTTVELLPVAAWIDERHLGELHLKNYWGYNPVAFMAPDPRLAPGGHSEIRATIDAFHQAGIEVILDVVLNHTGEGDEFGPTLSFRGLDNASYYRLNRDDQRRYVDDAGCGNCLALDRLPVVRFAMDVLRNWAVLSGIDGFRFDLAAALGRRDAGFEAAAPLLAAIAQDPILRELKLVAEPWDMGPGGHQLGAFPALWAEWNDRFRDDVRRFWRGDGTAADLATRFAGSSDIFGPSRPPTCSVNYITSHDGMTLSDLVSYEGKHNEANGEENRDGTNNNFSWNCGIEGASADPAIRTARQCDQRALLATLLVSRGTPMLAMGSELAHSQSGNNNAYAQDNRLSWLNWIEADSSLSDFVRDFLVLRRTHSVLRQDRWLTGTSLDGSPIADVEWRNASGRQLTNEEWHQPTFATLVVALAASGQGATVDRVIVVFHRGRNPVAVTLPQARPGHAWQLLCTSACTAGSGMQSVLADVVTIDPRCVVLFEEATGEASWRRRAQGVEAGLLDALCSAAGISADWWDIGGTHHTVSNDTKRALLAGMGLAAKTDAQVRESMQLINARRDRAGLPYAWLFPANTAADLPLQVEPLSTAVSLRIECEDGSIDHVRVAADDGRVGTTTRSDGTVQSFRLMRLPPLAAGRHRVVREDLDGITCTLTSAPPQCYRPPSLADGGTVFGIAAQLYALRRSGDQGIGDFTTLERFAARASALGAATIAINPLHALFGGERERASPYQPSDRRFLDPIYIDLDALSDLPGGNGSITTADWSALSQLNNVDYSRVWQLKRNTLQARFAAFEALLANYPDDATARDFYRFVADGGIALRQFACFEVLSQVFGPRHSGHWPAALQRADPPEVEAFASARENDLRFYYFLQYLADRQLGVAAARLKQAGLTLGLYRDLALGAAPDGAETWSNADQFIEGVSIGAPPDPFSAQGQVWHLAPLNPLRLASTGYRSFLEPLRANMRHGGVLRIDHILGLARLFCVPDGGQASDGTYISFPLDDLIGQLTLESVRHRCVIVGEDLGTVPSGLRDKLAEADILSYRVLWFERDRVAFKEPASYPSKAAACVSTHDLPTLSGWWIGQDIEERSALGQWSSEARASAHAQRVVDKENLVAALQKAGLASETALSEPTMTAALARDIHAYVAATPCSIVLAQAEDLVGETRAVNLPGTDQERPNWRRKLDGTIDDLLESDRAQSSLERLRALRPKSH